MTKTATVTALLKTGEIVSYSVDVTDSWNEAVKLVDPDMLARGYGMAGAEEEFIEVAARESGFAQRADFLEWRVLEVA